MALEIERRFLVKGDAWRALSPPKLYKQGYLSVEKTRTVRVRIVETSAWLTLKGAISDVSRHEFEYPIPLADAQTLLDTMCPMVVEKHRHRIQCGDLCWEVDEFFGDNAGLILAEVELPAEDTPFARPDWLGEEVTHDGRFTNAYLSQHPYRSWGA